jgi:hypothetical protein
MFDLAIISIVLSIGTFLLGRSRAKKRDLDAVAFFITVFGLIDVVLIAAQGGWYLVLSVASVAFAMFVYLYALKRNRSIK